MLRRHRLPVAALAWAAGCCVAGRAFADPPAIATLAYSADTGANLIDAATFVARRDFVVDDRAGARTRQVIAGLPDTVILRDFHIEPNGNVLFALDVTTTLGGVTYTPADVIRYSGSFSREFDAVAAGVPDGVRCDGVARYGDGGALLLSFDRTFKAGALTIRPADVVVWKDGAFGPKVLDAKALGLSDTLNVDAIDTFRTRRYLLASFDGGGTVGGLAFTASDVLQLDRATGAWTRLYAPATVSDRWQHANLDGLAASNVDTIFQSDHE